MTCEPLATLTAFRRDLSHCFERRADALFELTDALLTADPIASPAYLSLEPVHRRGWGSLYATLAHGRIAPTGRRALLGRHPLAAGQSLYAVAVSVWPRWDAETSPERGSDYHPSRHSAGQPIVAGWAYHSIAQLSFSRDSWTAPVDGRRVHPTGKGQALAADQIRAVLRTRPLGVPTPLFVFDAGDDPEQLVQALDDLPVAILVRLRRDRCFYADPTAQPPVGRPRQHGAKFACRDVTTWPEPTAEYTAEDEQYGRVRVRAGSGLHAKRQNHPERGTRRTKPVGRGTLVLVEVSRLPAKPREPQQLWLWWHGPGTPDRSMPGVRTSAASISNLRCASPSRP